MVLRPYCDGDRPHFVNLFGDADVSGFVGGPKTEADASALFDSLREGTHPRALVAFAACDEVLLDRMVGHAVLFGNECPATAELGYMIERESWGRGFGTAVATALLDEARARGFTIALGSVDLDNRASRRILEKLGGTALMCSDEDGLFMEYRIAL